MRNAADVSAQGVPAVSVVVPAFNVQRFLPACLASLLDQSCGDWEAIVVDDGSTDDTAGCVARAGDARLRLVRQSNLGVSTARNNGLQLARGRYLMFLDGDDVLHPRALERLRTALDEDGGSVAAFGTLRKILEDGSPYPQQKPLRLNRYPTGNVLEPMLRENFLANGGQIMLRTGLVRRLGGFNAALRLSEDWELWCRLAAQGPFRFIGTEPEVFHLRVRAGSSSGPLASTWANHLASIGAVLANPDLHGHFPPAQWRALRRQVMASHMWEAGRVNFTIRRFAEARRLMLASLLRAPRPKRLVLFGLAQVSQVLNLSIVSRLRFQDHDQARIG